MVSILYRSNKIPVLYPIFIAITALARLVVLQSKDMEPTTIIFEAGAIFILAVAAFALRFAVVDGLAPKNSHDDASEI